jgi:polyferredoxin
MAVRPVSSSQRFLRLGRGLAVPFFVISGFASILALGALSVVAGWSPPAGGLPPILAGVFGSLLAPVFLVGASAEMLVVGFLFRRDLDARLRWLLIAQAGLVFLTPTTMPTAGWGSASALVGIALFVAMFIGALQFIYRNKQIAPSTSRLLVRWTVAGAFTSCGWLVWHLFGSPVVLVPSILLQVGVFLGAMLGASPAIAEQRLPWLRHPFWVLEILLFTFLAEFFLGALLDLAVAGPGFLQFVPFLAYPSGGAGLIGTAVYNGLWFAAAILASAWFLVVMGFTMSALVVFKIRETRERAQRYRLGLMIAVYALAAVYIPSFASSTPIASVPALANLPVVGWGFGLRSGGPFESSVFLAILVMYAAVGVLTVLFGRKALCSVMCGAALLYQGTTISEMRGFNQTSRVGRYFLGSQLSTAYVVASSLALVSLFATSLLGVLHLLPAVPLPNGEVDTSALPLPIELYFGALWFAMFVSIPYVGTYNCATTGFCHWGALSIPFAKVGLFRLKVKDRKVCQQCTTFDCAKACPVGLVDMPLHFRTKGEYRSTKCCGVGDCVGACPYGNMYHQDVRFWIRRRLSRSAPTPRGSPLPMLSPTPPSAAHPVNSAAPAPASGHPQ